MLGRPLTEAASVHPTIPVRRVAASLTACAVGIIIIIIIIIVTHASIVVIHPTVVPPLHLLQKRLR
jgi:hypothetical protein